MLSTSYKKIRLKSFNSSVLFSASSVYNKRVVFKSRDEVKKLYETNLTSDADLSKLKKVYFDPTSKFPRFKLSEFTNIKRCLKASSADAVIISTPKLTDLFYRSQVVFRSPSSNMSYMFDKYNLTSSVYIPLFNKEEISIDELKKYLIDADIIEADCEHIFTGYVFTVSEASYKSLLNIENIQDKIFISDHTLDQLISETQESPDLSDLETIKEFISSPDLPTVALGMKLLLNYNVLKKPCSVGLLLLRNGHNILKTKASKSIGFKNLLSSLKLSKYDLDYFRESNSLGYISQFCTIAQDNEEIEEFRQLVVDIISKNINNNLNIYNNTIKLFNIQSEIKIY